MQCIVCAAAGRGEVKKIEKQIKKLRANAAESEKRDVAVVGADQDVATSQGRRCLVMLLDNAVRSMGWKTAACCQSRSGRARRDVAYI